VGVSDDKRKKFLVGMITSRNAEVHFNGFFLKKKTKGGTLLHDIVDFPEYIIM
jgi:hypothetical protein